MLNLNELQRLKHLHRTIRDKGTGSPAQMANRLGISERSLFRLVEKLKEMNAPIYFDRNQNTYSYREPFELEISISIRVLSKGETHTLYGGQVKKNHSLPGFGREARYFYPTKPEIARKTVWKIFLLT